MDKKFNKILIVIGAFAALSVSFILGWGVCLFQASPDTDEKAIEVAVEEATRNLQADFEKAEAEAKNAKDELKKVKSQQKAKSSDSSQTPSLSTSSIDKKFSIYKEAFETIFPNTGERFVMNDKDFRFYSDKSCSPETLLSTEDLIFVNSRDEEGENDSGFTIFVSRSTKGPVFSVEQPYFDYK